MNDVPSELAEDSNDSSPRITAKSLVEAYRKLVKNLPAEQEEKAMTSIAARTLRADNAASAEQSKGARV